MLGHGSGGEMTHKLISNLFVKYFSNEFLDQQTDSAILPLDGPSISFTTDSFVVDPIFFPGGDIGKLAVAGTVNDLAVSGAEALYISCSFIIEEGFPMDHLEKIVKSMRDEADGAGVKIVTGDTKVVDRGKCDKLFINTSGIGKISKEQRNISFGKDIVPGDQIIINGSIADHGMSIMAARNDLNIQSAITSDCASLNKLIGSALRKSSKIRFMRDATRGGLATVLTELASQKKFGVKIDESAIQVKDSVRGMCELLGFDPLYVANEGKVVMVVAKEDSRAVLNAMKEHPHGSESAIIGEISEEHPGRAWVNTEIGGKRLIDMLAGEQLPRIC